MNKFHIPETLIELMSTIKFLYENMFRNSDSFRVFASSFCLLVLGLVSSIFSVKANKCCNSNDQVDKSSYMEGDNNIEFVNEEEAFEVKNVEVNKTEGEKDHCVKASSTSKCEVLPGKHINGFDEAPKTLTVSVREFYLGSNDSTNCGKILATEGEGTWDSVDKVLTEQEEVSSIHTDEGFDQEKTEDYVKETSFSNLRKVFYLGKTEDSVSVDKVLDKKLEGLFSEDERSVFTEFKFLPKYGLSDEVLHLSEDCFSQADSETDTIGSSDDFSRCNDSVEWDAYDFLAERNFDERFGSESFGATSDEEEDVEITENRLNQEKYVVTDVKFDFDDDYIDLRPEFHISSVINEAVEDDLFCEDAKAADSPRLCEESDLIEVEDHHGEEDLVYEATELGHPEFVSDSDGEDDDECTSEYDELIEQLRMELRNARTGGLPTILEESESLPKTIEDLKPMKIDQKLEHRDHMKEIQKFYRSYSDKMRKLDIFNSQTLHAIGLFQRKELGQSSKTPESSIPAIRSLLWRSLWPCNPRRREAKLVSHLQKDLELVYVGQLCLSWEILHWQYRKALELQEFDSQQLCQYNQVAGEFQLFQVLLRRFVENEPFQGCYRVENYVNHRFARCNFLQVPVIKDDRPTDEKGRKRDEEAAITSPMLTSVIEESMRVYWDFLCADKHEDGIILKSPELQDPADSELLTDVRTDFQKKEKRLRQLMSRDCCIIKKLQKDHEDRFSRAFFFAQVELKLISRVMIMSKLTTDQLMWCHEKLARINFCYRKLVLEPSFLPFPC